MGYYATLTDAWLRITDQDAALAALRPLLTHAAPRDLQEAFGSLGEYEEVAFDDKGNLTELCFSGKYREEEVWEALAPFISPHASSPDIEPFVEWRGEDGDQWRFVFSDGCMRTESARLTWTYETEVRRSPANVEPLALEGDAKTVLADSLRRHIAHLSEQHGEDATVVAEARMTLKSVTDADRVALDLEVLR